MSRYLRQWQTVDTPQGPQQAIWVDVFKVGTSVFVGEEEIELTAALVGEVVQNFESLKTGESTFTPPVQRQHDLSTGMQEGEVHALRLESGFLQALITFADPEVREAYNRGQVRFFSPGFSLNFQDPHSGREVGATLLELSFVSEPQQKNLRDPRDINPGVTLAAQEPNVMAEEQMELASDEEEPEAFNAQAAFEGLDERLAKLEALQEGDEEEEEEELGADEATEKMAARIRDLEDQNTRLELGAFDVDADEVTNLVALKRSAPALFASHVQRLPVRGSGLTVQAEIGMTGATAMTGKATAEAILLEAEGLGVKVGNGKLSLWLAQNHPTRLAEVVAFAATRN